MILQTLIGSTAFSRLLFFAACTFVAMDFLATIVTVVYQRYWYKKVVRPKFSSGYAPRCAIIVPCKGNNANLRSNLECFFDLNYHEYMVVFVTESPDDTAVPVIMETIANRRNGRHVAAGVSSRCAQKNHNLLAGIAVAQQSDAEVYVFADSDIKPGPFWLREIILPLADSSVTVTTSFRWLHAKKGTVAEWTHTYANIFIYIVFSCAFFLGGVGLWGGSMAMRRKEFETLDVAKKWSKSVVDDLSLSQIIHKRKLKGVMVSSCVTYTDELFSNVASAIGWFKRQIMFLKVYFKHLWFFLLMPAVVVCMILMFTLPAAIVFSLSETRTFFGSGGGAALIFYIGELMTVSLYPLLGPMPRFHRFLFLQPFIRVTQAASYVGTWANTITWSGVRYRLKFFGDVKQIERLNKR